jgi:23S rRNA (adenine2503-C2)-methyltransferase
MTLKINLLDLALEDLEQLLVSWEQPRFRAGQVWQWLYRNLATTAEEMANLPRELRARLDAETCAGCLESVERLVSADGEAEKALMRTRDDQVIETVLMRYDDRRSVCVSSQVGCPIHCAFCATGQRGFVRNLSAGEIAAQVLHYARLLRGEGTQVTNVVFMGMGEPLYNLDAVWRAILNLNEAEGLGLGARRFTISTAGIVPGIEHLARAQVAVGLAVSLHAPDNALRDKLVPINQRYPLERLLSAVKLYIKHTGRRVTFEYCLARGVNDGDAHARGVARLLQGLLCHVNLIPLNAVAGAPYQPSAPERVTRFQELLEEGRIQTTVRLRRGEDIQAGCGQLRGRYLDETTLREG